MQHLRKNGYYYTTYRDRNGQRKYKSLNTTDHKEAVRIEKKFKENLGGMTLSELREQFRKSKVNKSKKYQLSIRDCSWEFLKFVGNKPLKIIDVQDIINYQHFLKNRSLKANSVTHHLGVLRSIFNWGYKSELIDKDIFRTFEIDRPQPKIEWLNVQEIQELLSVIDNDNLLPEEKLLNRYFLEACLLTGARRSEISNLEWKNIDPDFIHFWQTKTKKPHHFPMNLQLAKVFNGIWILQRKGEGLFSFKRVSNERVSNFGREGNYADILSKNFLPLSETSETNFFDYIEEIKETSENTKIVSNVNASHKTGYVLSNLRGKKISGDWLAKMVKKYFIRAGLNETYTLHTLRHTFACNLLLKEVPIYTVSKLLNHKSVKTTEDFYSHVTSEYMKTDTHFYAIS